MSPDTIEVGDRSAPLFAGDADWDLAQAALLADELADGLPAVVPTEGRLAAMLAGRDPGVSLARRGVVVPQPAGH